MTSRTRFTGRSGFRFSTAPAPARPARRTPPAPCPERGRTSASSAAPRSPCARPIALPAVRRAAAPPASAATRSSPRCRSTAPPPSNSPSAAEREPPAWLDEAREQLSRARLPPGDARAGRDPDLRAWRSAGPGSAAATTAEICLDDPSVSRRHAIVDTKEGRAPRVLDDRSLNGILVNGRKVDVAELKPGDELTIGRHRLYLLQA